MVDKTKEDIIQDKSASDLAKRVTQLEKQVGDQDAELKALAPLAPLIDKVSQILRHFGQ